MHFNYWFGYLGRESEMDRADIHSKSPLRSYLIQTIIDRGEAYFIEETEKNFRRETHSLQSCQGLVWRARLCCQVVLGFPALPAQVLDASLAAICDVTSAS